MMINAWGVGKEKEQGHGWGGDLTFVGLSQRPVFSLIFPALSREDCHNEERGYVRVMCH